MKWRLRSRLRWPGTLLLVVAAMLSGDARGSGAAPAVQWRELGDPRRSAHSIVWDSRRDRALMFGGDGDYGTPFPGSWELVRTPSPHWEALATQGIGPTPRSGASAVYDSLRDRVLLFGGRVDAFGAVSAELWELRLAGDPEWRLLETGSEPALSGRCDASMILDARDRLLLFGGEIFAATSDSLVWILPLSEFPLRWRAAPVTGPGPGARARHGAAYSAVTNRMLVFGGEQSLGSDELVLCTAVTWELSLDEPVRWIRSAAAPVDSVPLPEIDGPLVADGTGRSAWLIPGDQSWAVDDPSVWRYDFIASTWSRVHSGAGGPGLRAGAAACMARPSGDLIVHGGGRFSRYGHSHGGETSATWRVTTGSTPSWSSAVPSPAASAPPAWDPRAHFDAATRRLVTRTREGVWTRDVSGAGPWQLAAMREGDVAPSPDAMSVLDPLRRRLLVFGGLEGSRPIPASQLWAWQLDGPDGWVLVPIEGETPPSPWGPECAYDPARDRVLVLYTSRGALDTIAVLELGAASPRWRSLATSGGPPTQRMGGSTLVDSVHDRLILQGGNTGSYIGAPAWDLWTLSLGETPRWTLRMSYWGDHEIDGHGGLAIDPTLNRIILIGGTGLSQFSIGDFNPIRSAPLDDPIAWLDLDPTDASPMRGAGTAFFDDDADRMLWWNGATLWELTWPLGTPGAYGPASTTADAGGVHVRWPGDVSGPYVAVIERSMDGARTWSRLGSVAPGADGSLAFTDSLPPQSGALAYRAIVERAGVRRVLGTASLTLGNRMPATFSFAAPRPNPASDAVTLEFAVPVGSEVTLELFDLLGRQVDSAVHWRVAAGKTAFTLPLASSLAPGMYLLRASDGARFRNARLVVVH